MAMTNFPQLTNAHYEKCYGAPQLPAAMVLDTDTFNEIDDQFAVVYAQKSPDSCDLRGIVAAPFTSGKTPCPAEGMRLSYQELENLFRRMEICSDKKICHGSETYLPDRHTPVRSEGVDRIIFEADRAAAEGKMLYLTGIAVATDLASVFLLRPDLVAKITVVWLGGNPVEWRDNNEYNLRQDVAAAQVLYDCGVPLIVIPCQNVADHLNTTTLELTPFLRGRNAVSDYLLEIFSDYNRLRGTMSKVIWDIATIATFRVPEAFRFDIVPSPILLDDRQWRTVAPGRHPVKIAYAVERDLVFRDLFARL
ncbi:MAG: nucleoside hydrolase [Victivallaceae bacterium]|nr:nucleoside hydrolase [Victivallaceae bacterium]